MPLRMVPTIFGLSVSDTYFADVNGDHVPEIAIGRLPVLTQQELQTVIGKIMTYEATTCKHAILVADNLDDAAGNFTADSRVLEALFPQPPYTLTKIYLDEPLDVDTARYLLFSAINSGALYLNYIGHAGILELTADGLLSTDDLEYLTNQSKLPVMTAMTCSMGDFSIPGLTTLGEGLLLKDGGGVAAVWSPTGLSDDSQAAILNREFYRAIFRGGKKVLGDAVRQAFNVYKITGSLPFMIDIYNILGDPAMRLR
jgi:hypothetical protein